MTISNAVQLYGARYRTRKVVGKGKRQSKLKPTVTSVKVDNSEESGDDGEEGDSDEDSESEDEEWDSEEEYAADGEIKDYMFPTEPFKMILCVNTSLKKMDKGKAMAQCGHATLGAYRISEKYAPSNVKTWCMMGQTKIAIKVTEEEMLEIVESAKELGVVNYVVEDAGRTQIPAGSKTVCGLGPAPASVLAKFTSKFKLM